MSNKTNVYTQYTDFFALAQLLEALKNEGLDISPNQYNEIFRVAEHWQPTRHAMQVRFMLRAIVCKNNLQQAVFDKVWERHLLQLANINELLKKGEEPGQNSKEQQLPQNKQSLNNWWKKQKDSFRIWLKKLATKKKKQKVLKNIENEIAAAQLNIYTEPINPQLPESIKHTAMHLRTREETVSQTLDIKKTIKATIKQLGLLTPVYTNKQKHIEFLILVQKYSPADHRAALFDVFVDELKYRNVELQRYFFGGDARLCFNEHNKTGKELEHVVAENHNSTLLVLADPQVFINTAANKPNAWTSPLLSIDKRILLYSWQSPLISMQNNTLKKLFEHQLPISETGLAQLYQILNTEGQTLTQTHFVIEENTTADYSPVYIERSTDINQLNDFAPDLKEWIAAALVFPSFSWNLMLFLGKALSTPEKNRVTWDNIRQLNRISWFRDGYIPNSHAAVLLQKNWLSPEASERVSKAINQQLRTSIATKIYGNNDYLLVSILKASQNPNEQTQKLKQYNAHDPVFTEISNNKNLKNLRIFTPDDDVADLLSNFNPEKQKQAQTSQTSNKQTFNSYTETTTGVPFGMVAIKGGKFKIGSGDNPKYDSEKSPDYDITVSDFYMEKTEVTIAEFKAFIDATGYKTDADKNTRYKGSYAYIDGDWKEKEGVNWKCDVNGNKRPQSEYNHPVMHVSWNDAKAYCGWLSQETEKKYHLPSEAEWEYAARCGENYEYAGSDNLDEVAWYTKTTKNKGTREVATKKKNGYGLYDMSGNVWEWCEDDWHGNYSDGIPKDGKAWIDKSRGADRVLRGGSWGSNAGSCRVANRSNDYPASRYYLNGFRVACSL